MPAIEDGSLEWLRSFESGTADICFRPQKSVRRELPYKEFTPGENLQV